MQPSDHTPISKDELQELARLLATLPSEQAMSLAMLDGFFAALIAGPALVLPSEYLPIVCGVSDEDGLVALGEYEQAQTLIHLLTRLWNTIADALKAGLHENKVYLANFDVDERGRVLGNEWANGFLRGLRMRSENWSVLLNDPRDVHLMVPIFTLAHEHSSAAELRSGPIGDEQRTKLIRQATAYLTLIYRYFAPVRAQGDAPRESVQHGAGKVGRNDPCPCGSGKKYKQCCGNPARLH